MSNIVKFNGKELELINQNNQLYMTKGQIATALEYAEESQISKLYNAHKSEFDDEMSCLIKHGRTRVRIFNREGAWLIGMFARTPKAAEFRKWVLKVLGAVADGQQADKPVSVSEHTRALPSGKKEIVLSEKARSEIGGIFKACLPGIIREEAEKLSQDMIYKNKFKDVIAEVLHEEMADFILKGKFKTGDFNGYPTADGQPFANWAIGITHAVSAITVIYDQMKERNSNAVKLLSGK